jgi:hypothetical protein
MAGKKETLRHLRPSRPPALSVSLSPSLPPSLLFSLSLLLFRSVSLLVGPNRTFIVFLVYRNHGSVRARVSLLRYIVCFQHFNTYASIDRVRAFLGALRLCALRIRVFYPCVAGLQEV